MISHSMSKIGGGGGGCHHAGTQYSDCLPISQPQYWRRFRSFRTKCFKSQIAPPWPHFDPLKNVKTIFLHSGRNVETNKKKPLRYRPIWGTFVHLCKPKTGLLNHVGTVSFLFSDGVAEVFGSCDKRGRVCYQWKCPAKWGSCYCCYTRTASWCEGTLLHQNSTTHVRYRVSCVTVIIAEQQTRSRWKHFGILCRTSSFVCLASLNQWIRLDLANSLLALVGVSSTRGEVQGGPNLVNAVATSTIRIRFVFPFATYKL
jgi:hypothetical protein